MPITPEQGAYFAETFSRIAQNVGYALLGKEDSVRLVLSAMLAEGHVLLEDAPGTGKTSLAKAIAASIDGTHKRIQFTPDLLPSDVVGNSVYDQSKGTFQFHQGPIFASIVLADEINRASPKTQSALLQVMEESRVTVDLETYLVGRPFTVIATQNPIEQAGTYRLPEAQLDRFLIKTSLEYPDRAATVQILAQSAVRDRTAALKPVISTEKFAELADITDAVHIDPAILDYVARIVEATRADSRTALGASMRGALSLVRLAKVWALSQGRVFVLPDDIKALAQPVLAHRIILDTEAEFAGVRDHQVISDILAQTHPPTERGN